jgi:TonB family protein
MAPVAPVSSPTIERVGPTGSGGSRPGMLYPPEAQQRKLQGTVKLFFEVNESGIITDVKITQSSGSVLLDRAAIEHIKRRWMLGTGPAGRQYETEFVFQLK